MFGCDKRSLTILLDYRDDARKGHYARLVELYKKLGDDSKIIDENRFGDLFNDDVKISKSIAKELAIPLVGKFKIEELQELYIRMRGIIEAA